MEINKNYYIKKLDFKINEIVLFRDKFHKIIFDHNDGNVNLKNCNKQIIFNVPKMFLFKNNLTFMYLFAFNYYLCNSDNENILKSLSTVAVDWLFLN